MGINHNGLLVVIFDKENQLNNVLSDISQKIDREQ